MQKINDNIYVLISFGIIGTLLLSVGIIYFFSSYIRRIALQKVELQKKETEFQARLFTAVIESQQEEQRKIGREMHDEAGAILSTIKLRLSNAAEQQPGDTVLSESIASLNKLSGIIRNISHVLSPPELELSGFHDALDSLCNCFPSTGKTIIRLQDNSGGIIPKKNFQLSLSLFRVVQELITNSVKHAGASVINIHLHNKDNMLVIEYDDNGKGIDKSQLIKGLGFQNIQSRLMMIHAAYTLGTEVNNGFRFNIYLEHRFIS
ncbi:MAG: ATP-binding protein [Bacteroidetes bacterium]|nr:ATP-binding protein [Bacteroidota bacterium]